MSFYDDASIVMIPSGYKASKLYSAKPTDGSGDLTFTRTGSTATRVNESGLIEKCLTNIVLHSQNFANAAWSKSAGTTLTHSQIDANGGTTATRVVMTSGTNNFFTQSISGNGVRFITLSVFIKGVTSGGSVSLNTGTAASRTGTTIAYTTNWSRYQIIQNETTSNTGFQIDNFSDSVGQVAGDFLISFAQVESSDFGATPYIPTTTAAVTVGPIANLPRLDYTGGGCPKLLMEPTRTNLFNYSEQFNNSYWPKSGISISSNFILSPDGYINSDKVIANNAEDPNATNANGIQLVQSVTSGTYTVSFFAKAGEHTIMRVRENAAWGNFLVINLITGVLTTSGGDFGQFVDRKSQNVGNGWWRISFTTPAGVTNLSKYSIRSGITGDGTSGFYLWGAQVELGSYATSYIPTVNASVTRNADNATKASATALIGQTEGTIYFEGIVSDFASTNFGVWGVQNAATSSHIHIASGNNDLFVQSYNGTTSLFFTTLSYTKGTLVKIALAYKAGDYAVYKNGTLILSGTNATAVPICDRIETNRLWLSPGDQRELINQGLIFKTRLSNSDLATLTTL